MIITKDFTLFIRKERAVEIKRNTERPSNWIILIDGKPYGASHPKRGPALIKYAKKAVDALAQQNH